MKIKSRKLRCQKITTIENSSLVFSKSICQEGKYWVRPYTRKRIDRDGKVYIQHVKGYCCSYHDHYIELAKQEKMKLDHMFLALTIYGESRMESTPTKKAVAWIIRNRLNKSKKEKTYREIVHKKNQFSCWQKNDPNFKRIQHPGKHDSHDSIDMRSWHECKIVAEEVHNELEENNPIPNVYHYFSGAPNPKKHPWQKNYFDLQDIPNLHFVKLPK